MSIGRQFRRQGEIAIARLLWGLIIWLVSNPKYLLLVVGMFALLAFFVDADKKRYVNVNTIDAYDKPFGKKVKTLHLNDSLMLIEKLSENWLKVAVGNDTLFLKDKDDAIQRTPFNKYKALVGEKVTIQHPDGYYDTGSKILKNGDVVTVVSYSETDRKIRVSRSEFSETSEIAIEHVKVDWTKILKKYPRLKESSE